MSMKNKVFYIISKLVIHNSYSGYTKLLYYTHNHKISILIALLICPITYSIKLFLNPHRIKINQLKNDRYIVNFRYRNIDIKFYVPGYDSDVIDSVIFNYDRFYELEILEDLHKYLNNDSVIFDIGANVGNHAIYFSKIVEAKHIYAFEPIQSTFKKLSKNIEINNCSNVTLYNVGLGASHHFGDIKNMSLGNSMANRIQYSDNKGDLIIEALDNLEFPNKASFVKIDVEGFELEVLKGAVKTFSESKPLIFIEIKTENIKIINEILNRIGYSMIKEYSNDNYLFEHKQFH
jgi:FkbM family methyltransferase